MNPHELAVELIRRLNERDIDGAVALFATHAEVCFPRFSPRAVYRGDAGLRELFEWLTGALPVQTFAVDRISGSRDTVTVEFEAAGESRLGHGFDSTGALVLDIDDGLIRAIRVYVDTADLGRILEVA